MLKGTTCLAAGYSIGEFFPKASIAEAFHHELFILEGNANQFIASAGQELLRGGRVTNSGEIAKPLLPGWSVKLVGDSGNLSHGASTGLDLDSEE